MINYWTNACKFKIDKIYYSDTAVQIIWVWKWKQIVWWKTYLNLQNEKWYKLAVKSTRTRKGYRTYWLFSFRSDNWQKLAISFQKLVIFNIYIPCFCSIHEALDADFCICFGLCDCRNEAPFLILENIPAPGGLNKKHEILVFKPLLQEIQLKNLTIRKLFWSPNI